MKRHLQPTGSCVLAICLFSAISHAGESADQWYRYTPNLPDGYSISTNDSDLPALLFLQERYGIGEVVPCSPLPEGILAQIIYPDGHTRTISNRQQRSAKTRTTSPSQVASFPLIADDCLSLDGQVFPFVFGGENLPYQESFDTSAAVDSGDYRGSAADSISRPGGHDGFWSFTPSQAGTYLFSLAATKGASTPIPDHEFDRGFGGIGVWQGICGQTLTEIGTTSSILGDSVLPVYLDAETSYFVIWEDFYVGSTENSVTLSVQYLGEPVGNSINDAVSLAGMSWPFSVDGDTTANQNLSDNECLEDPDEGTGHGAGTNALTGAEIWYRLPATAAGIEYTLEILPGTGAFPVVDSLISLHAYNLSTHQVSHIDCNDDINEENRLSSLTFTAEASRIYYVTIETKPAYDQPGFGQFLLQGHAATAGVDDWMHY